MSRFNSSISTVGIKEAKVQQAILKLLENSLFQRELIAKISGSFSEETRLIKQKMQTQESVAWSHVNVDLEGSTFLMEGLVSDSHATYKVTVTFRNTGTTAYTVSAGGVSAELDAGEGETASVDFSVAGDGTFAIDNISSDVDVFVRIWR